MVAVLAHGLALIRREILGLPGPDPDRCAVAALYHDASEILTGDLPTPIKYHDRSIRAAYKDVEKLANEKLLAMLPEELHEAYRSALFPEGEEERLVKAADKLSALVKCIEERKFGNREFASAEEQARAALAAMALPEADWFMENCLPAFEKNLDELGTMD